MSALPALPQPSQNAQTASAYAAVASEPKMHQRPRSWLGALGWRSSIRSQLSASGAGRAPEVLLKWLW
jgi:hypothetical protein